MGGSSHLRGCNQASLWLCVPMAHQPLSHTTEAQPGPSPPQGPWLAAVHFRGGKLHLLKLIPTCELRVHACMCVYYSLLSDHT